MKQDQKKGVSRVENEKIKNTCQELLEVCVKNGLSISDMFEVSRAFRKTVEQQIDTLEHNTVFTVSSDLNAQE